MMATPTISTTIFGRCVAAAGRATTIAVNFARENAPESSTRLCMILFAITGCAGGLATIAFGFKHPDQTGMVIAMTGVDTLYIGGGAVAIALRMRKGAEPGDGGSPGGGAA